MISVHGNQVIFVCGEQSEPSSLEKSSLRNLIISNLAVYWSIRTHPTANTLDPRNEITDTFQTIARSNVFVFIFTKETIQDSFYLNQYGIAKSYGVPVVGVRTPSFILPNPLPEQYYFTEIIDQSSAKRGDFKRHEKLNTNKKKTMLTDVLVQDFRNAMVYTTEFHKPCIERLLHKVKISYNKSEKEKIILAALNNNTNQHGNEVKESQARFPKCAKCGFVKKRTGTPTLQRASSTGSLLRKTNAFENESAAGKNCKRATLLPSTIQISSPYVSRSPLKIKLNSQISRVDEEAEQNQTQRKSEISRGTPQLKAEEMITSNTQKNDEKDPTQSTNGTSSQEDVQKGAVLRKQSRISNTWTEKLRYKLRRQSSLPIVPTTYLLTTPDGLQTTMHFVKYPPEKKESPSPRSKELSIFSEDEEGEIHISRVPSPDAPSF